MSVFRNPRFWTASCIALMAVLIVCCPQGPQQLRRSAAADDKRPAAGPAGTAVTDKADKGWIGIMLEQSADGKVRVADVFPGGPAAFAGVRAGDLVAKVGGKAASSLDSTRAVIEQLVPDSDAQLVISRGGRDVPVTVHTGSLLAFHTDYSREMFHRDPRHPDFGKAAGVSSGDMAIELVRRLFEQNQRLEIALQDVRQELKDLRGDIEKMKH